MKSGPLAIITVLLIIVSMPASGVQVSGEIQQSHFDDTTDVFTHDFETVYGTYNTTDGMYLADEYNETHGVSFSRHLVFSEARVQAITCADEGICDTARSGNTVIRGDPAHEFRNDRVVISFDEPKRFVSIYVKESDREGDKMTEDELMQVEMLAFSPDQYPDTQLYEPILSDSESFGNDTGWHELAVGDSSGPANISSIVLSGQVLGAGFESNFFIMDDLSFPLDGGPQEPPADIVPPSTTIIDPPAGSAVSDETIQMYLTATDDRRLANVSFELRSKGTDGAPAQSGTLCGDGSRFFPCPPSDNQYETTVPLNFPSEGDYTITVTACDLAGKCSADEQTVKFDKPTTDPREIRSPVVVELSQGVQSRLFEVPDGSARVVEPGLFGEVPMLANKTTVIRVYPLGENGEISEYSGKIDMEIVNTDGSKEGVKIDPNAVKESITVPEDPESIDGRQELLWKMRANTSRSLNYVVPAAKLADADYIELNVPGVTATARVQFQPELTLGIIPYDMRGKTLPAQDKDELRGLYQHLRISYPISDLRVPRGGEWDSVTGAKNEDPFVGKSLRAKSNESDDLLARIQLLEFGLFTTQLTPSRGKQPDHVVAIGFGGSFKETGGRAFRPGVHAVSQALHPGPQEIGHTLGLKHASNDHGESDGGSWERWPYPHGSISRPPTSLGAKWATFGVIPNDTSTTGSATDWELTIVDPCPTTEPSNRLPECALDDANRTHDIMSYGPVTDETVGVFRGDEPFHWISDITYRGLYQGLVDRKTGLGTDSAETTASGVSDEGTQVEGLVVVGELQEGGTGELVMPPLRRPVAPSQLTGTKGSHTISLESQNGTVLAEGSFVPEANDHEDHDTMFVATLPYEPNATRLVVENESTEFLHREASAHAPEVNITGLDGGEVLDSGQHTVSWEASDPDGDQLTYLVQYSPDGGEHWEGVTVVESGQPTEATFEVRAFVPGRKGIVRVSATDGFNTAYDVSTDYFSVGTDAEPVLNRPPTVAAPSNQTIDEGESVTVETTFTDPDFLDTHGVEVDWGDGSVTAGSVIEDEGAGSVSATHVYGDNGVYEVTVNVTDDHGNVGTNTTFVTVGNLDPSGRLNTSAVITFDGGEAFLGRVNESQEHTANATDPGSDDLTFDWRNGSTTTYYNNGSTPDPALSPGGTFPFNATDTGTVNFDEPGVREVVVTVRDDDGGSVADAVTKLITGNGDQARSMGYWRKQYSEKGNIDYSSPRLRAFLNVTAFASAVFNENVSADSIGAAHVVLQTSSPSMRDKAEAQALAAWLNFASGRINWTDSIDVDGDGVGDRDFNAVIAEVETILNDEEATRQELERAKDLAESINQGTN